MTTICHFASNHEGLDPRIALKECVSLAAAGYDTHLVLTASQADVEKAAASGVTVHALPPATGRFTRMLRHTWRCYRTARRVHATVYHFHDPELIPFGIWLRLCGCKVIYDVHEDFPLDILYKFWLPKWTRKLVSVALASLEYVAARWFVKVVAATPFIAERFARITPSTININNFPWPQEFAPLPVSRPRRAQVCYVGSITRVRGLRCMIEALPLVPEVTFVLCGWCPEPGFDAELRALPGWSQVRYLGQVDRERARQVMAESVAGLVTLLPVPTHLDSYPVKLFEYMSAELAVIASDFPLWHRIVTGAGAGVCVDPESPEAIAGAIRTMLADPAAAQSMGKAGRAAILSTYNWPIEAAKLVNFYHRLA